MKKKELAENTELVKRIKKLEEKMQKTLDEYSPERRGKLAINNYKNNCKNT